MFGIEIELFNLILASEVNGVINPEDAKPEEVEVDKMEEGWWYSEILA
jgi:hypothetical protein